MDAKGSDSFHHFNLFLPPIKVSLKTTSKNKKSSTKKNPTNQRPKLSTSLVLKEATPIFCLVKLFGLASNLRNIFYPLKLRFWR